MKGLLLGFNLHVTHTGVNGEALMAGISSHVIENHVLCKYHAGISSHVIENQVLCMLCLNAQ